MANETDMWNDIENLEREAKLLTKCFNAKYNEGENELAEELKQEFITQFQHWGNYY